MILQNGAILYIQVDMQIMEKMDSNFFHTVGFFVQRMQSSDGIGRISKSSEENQSILPTFADKSCEWNFVWMMPNDNMG